MKNTVVLSALVLAFLTIVAATPALAQSGCSDSPENPTAILALAGSAGAIAAAVRQRLRRR